MINYTSEQTEMLVNYYVNADDKDAAVDDLAKILEKSPKSIIGKLDKEGVYLKKTYKSKTGRDPITKNELVHNIAIALNEDVNNLEGLANSSKPALIRLHDIITSMFN